MTLKKKCIFLILILVSARLTYAEEQTLSLSVSIADNYMVVGANGGFSPNFYYTKMRSQNGIRYVSLQKENEDVFDEVVSYLMLVRQKIIKPDSNDIILMVEPDDDAVSFSQKIQSYEPLIQKMKSIGITGIRIFSWTGEEL